MDAHTHISERTCDNCDEKAIAVVCANCKTFFCAECAGVLHKSKKKKGHITVSRASKPSADAKTQGFQLLDYKELEDLKEIGQGSFGKVYVGEYGVYMHIFASFFSLSFSLSCSLSLFLSNLSIHAHTHILVTKILSTTPTKPTKPTTHTHTHIHTHTHTATWRSTQVVVKKLKAILDKDLIAEFTSEAKVMERVGRHPNVLSFIGACTVPPNICMVSEFMSNGSVYDVLVKHKKFMKPPDWKIIVRMVMDTAAGILHLHTEGVIHRDLAIRNLLLDDQYRVKVCDFGMARIKNREDEFGQTKSNVGPIKVR